jgi:asparagine synthase (glutamine-hydrolysing)
MVSAVELRAPYLDAHVLDFAAALPVRDRVRGLATKRLLKRLALRHLPRRLVHRRKRGLSVPLALWLRGPLEAWARERLQAGRSASAGVRTEVAVALLDEHVARRADHARALWTLVVLEEWLAWASRRGGAPGDVATRRALATPARHGGAIP